METLNGSENSDRARLIAYVLKKLYGDEWLENRKSELSHILSPDSTWEDYVTISTQLATSVPIEVISERTMTALRNARTEKLDFQKRFDAADLDERKETIEAFRAFADEVGLEESDDVVFEVILYQQFAYQVDQSNMWDEIF